MTDIKQVQNPYLQKTEVANPYRKDEFPTNPPEAGDYVNLTEAFATLDASVEDIEGLLHSWITRLSCEWCGEEPNTILLTDRGITVCCDKHVDEMMKAARMTKLDLRQGPRSSDFH